MQTIQTVKSMPFRYGGADFSPCRAYRYSLWRTWDDLRGKVMFIGLNPSTADETADDPTVRRCIRYAMAWGYGGMYMTNIFAYRATDPAVMKAHVEPVGPGNDAALAEIASKSAIVVAAWGVHGQHLNRADKVAGLIQGLHCLSRTKDGHPGHPLYLRAALTPVPWCAPAASTSTIAFQ